MQLVISAVTPAKVFLIVWLVPIGRLISELFIETPDLAANRDLVIGVCAIGIVSVLAGCLLANNVKIHAKSDYIAPSRMTIRVILSTVALLATIGGLLSIRAWLNLGVALFSPNIDLFSQMNVIATEEGGGVLSGVAGRFFSLLPVLLVLSLYLCRHGQLKRYDAIVLGTYSLVLMISPRRAMLFWSTIAALVIWFQGKEESWKTLAATAVVTLVLFFSYFGVTQFYLGKIENLDIDHILESALYYYSSNLVVMDGLIGTDHFSSTWVILNSPARVINVIFDASLDVDLSVPFVPTPEPGNTLPAFYYFYKGGGFPGVIVCSLAVGFIATYMYRMYLKTRAFVYASMSAFFMMGLIVSVRECMFITYDFLYWIAVSAVMSFWLSPRARSQ